MGALHPMPSEGKQVTVRLRPGFGSAQVLLTGVVVQPSPAATVVQLDPLRDTTREALVELGIAEAGEEVEASPSPAESKVESTAASEPVASPEPSPPTSSPLVEAPAPGPEPPPSS